MLYEVITSFVSGAPPAREFRAIAKVRYRHPGEGATVRVEGDRLRVAFDSPQRSVTRITSYNVCYTKLLRVAGFTVLDDPSFGSSPFASLTSLDVGVKLMPLLSKRVEVEEITLREPVVTVIKNKAGVMNLSTIGPKGPARRTAPEPGTPQQASGNPLQALALLAVDRVSIDGGQLAYRDLSTTPITEYQIQNLDLALKSVRLGQTPTIHLAATVQPYNLPVTLDGGFGPLVERLEVKQYDFSLGLGKVVLTLKGALVGGTLNATLSSP